MLKRSLMFFSENSTKFVSKTPSMAFIDKREIHNSSPSDPKFPINPKSSGPREYQKKHGNHPRDLRHNGVDYLIMDTGPSVVNDGGIHQCEQTHRWIITKRNLVSLNADAICFGSGFRAYTALVSSPELIQNAISKKDNPIDLTNAKELTEEDIREFNNQDNTTYSPKPR